MGLFDKIKNILFEDEEEVKEMPVYNKDNVKKEEKISRKGIKKVEKEEAKAPVPIRVHIPDEEDEIKEEHRFKNIKKEVDDYSFETEKPLPSSRMSAFHEKELEVTEVIKKEEPKSVFQSFDEEEFERFNPHTINQDNKVKKESTNSINLRRTNSYTEAVNPSKPLESTKIEPHGKKPFRPSPVISPVYGILDKNYSKDDIVDKKNTLKREKINSIVYTPEITREPIKEVEETKNHETIDSVRDKAFGIHEQENDYDNKDLPKIVEVKEEYQEPDINYEDDEPNNEVIDNSNLLDEVVESRYQNKIDQEEYSADDTEEEYQEDTYLEVNQEPEIPKMSSPTVEEPEITYPKVLDEIEKTSTLQILDDIEKELNAIKPVNSKSQDQDVNEDPLDRGDTLENDLFNLIDSMYEKGEEDENND